MEIWGISSEGKTDEETAREGIDALERFIRELGLPSTLQEAGVDESTNLKQIADSCAIVFGGHKRMTREEILEIFKECFSVDDCKTKVLQSSTEKNKNRRMS